MGEQGWRSRVRALASHYCGPDSIRRHMWVEFVVGSRPCSERFFSGCSCFPLASKTNVPKYQFDPESEDHRLVIRNRLLSVILVKQTKLIVWTM